MESKEVRRWEVLATRRASPTMVLTVVDFKGFNAWKIDRLAVGWQ
jgi:hypothetical protein